jgi:hypothetical protein
VSPFPVVTGGMSKEIRVVFVASPSQENVIIMVPFDDTNEI